MSKRKIEEISKNIPEAEKPLIDETAALLPCRNRAKEIVAWTIIDKKFFEELSKYKFSVGAGKYAQFHLNRKKEYLHRYIYYMLMKGEKIEVVDHANCVRLDNRECNLRGTTFSFNSHNRDFSDIQSGKYRGVTQNKTMWRAQTLKGTFSFRDEDCAAYCYDLFALEAFGPLAKINGIEKPSNYEESKIHGAKPRELKNRGIWQRGNSFQVHLTRFGELFRKRFPTLEEAAEARDNWIEKKEVEHQEELQKIPITRNHEGIAIRMTGGKIPGEVLLDDADWRLLQDRKITHCNRYAYIHHEGRPLSLQMFLMGRKNAKDGLVVDHINGNPLDNRRSVNLRVVTRSQNSQNCKILGDNFRGTVPRAGKWDVRITNKGKNMYGGCYDDELVAAFVYNLLAVEIYGPGAALNDVPTPENYSWDGKRLVLK